jgi:hypothetical protein
MRVALDEFVQQVHFQFHGELGLNEAIAVGSRYPRPNPGPAPAVSEEESLLEYSPMWLFGFEQESASKRGVEFLRDDTSRNSYGTGKEKEIQTIVDRLTSDACTKAFESAGLTPPKTLLERGVVIGPASLLADSRAENLTYMGITEFARRRDVGVYSSGSNRAVTIRDHPGKIADTVDGRPRILLNASAFGSDLAWYITHEFIHAGGADARPNRFGSDLSYLGYGEGTIYVTGRLHSVKQSVKVGITEADIQNACKLD